MSRNVCKWIFVQLSYDTPYTRIRPVAREGNRGQRQQRPKLQPSKYSEALLQALSTDIGEMVVWRVESVVGVGRVDAASSLASGKVTVLSEGFRALWDTGAQSTIVTPDVAQKVGIRGDGMTMLAGVTGPPKPTPRARLVIAIAAADISTRRPHHQFHLIDHALIHDSGGAWDVLVGMDLMVRGDFEFVSDRAGHRIGVWRYPSRPRVIRYPNRT